MTTLKLRQYPWHTKTSSYLVDSFLRPHNYLRISLTERCNLRCVYCMPSEGVQLSSADKILSTPEVEYLATLFVKEGVNKIRLTGGEPTVRRDIEDVISRLGALKSIGLKELNMTSNGIKLWRRVGEFKKMGLDGVNLSLDTLDEHKYTLMTRRNGFEKVLKSIYTCLDHGIRTKINVVVMRGVNDSEIVDFIDFAKDLDVEVRFIEYMPFDGNKWNQSKLVPYSELIESIRCKYDLSPIIDARSDVSRVYQIKGHKSRIGFITSMTDNFCAGCNRIRITADGSIKVCLLGNDEVSLRDIIRDPIKTDRDVLEIVQMALKKKKKEHAGLNEIGLMPNRPMILVGG